MTTQPIAKIGYQLGSMTFTSVAEFQAFCQQTLEDIARCETNAILVTTELPENSSYDDVLTWFNRAERNLKEQTYRKLPEGMPEGVAGFAAELPPNTTRTTFFLAVDGPWPSEHSETRCTIEQTDGHALVCLHELIWREGIPYFAPTCTNIGNIANYVRQNFLPHLPATEIEFFNHVPSAMGTMRGEMFRKINFRIDNGRYRGPSEARWWTDYERVPPAIREAETAPYDDAPTPQPPARRLGATLNRLASSIGWRSKTKRLAAE